MENDAPYIARLSRDVEKLKLPPPRRARNALVAKAGRILADKTLADAFAKALDGSVEDAAGLAAALRPDWACTLTPQGDAVLARIAAPATGDTAPPAFTASRAADYPALALLDATLRSFAGPNAQAWRRPFGWRDLAIEALGLIVLLIKLALAAGFALAMWEIFFGDWD